MCLDGYNKQPSISINTKTKISLNKGNIEIYILQVRLTFTKRIQMIYFRFKEYIQLKSKTVKNHFVFLELRQCGGLMALPDTSRLEMYFELFIMTIKKY